MLAASRVGPYYEQGEARRLGGHGAIRPEPAATPSPGLADFSPALQTLSGCFLFLALALDLDLALV